MNITVVFDVIQRIIMGMKNLFTHRGGSVRGTESRGDDVA
jgi:hypothetical protein